MSTSDAPDAKPGEFGPFYRLQNTADNELVARTGMLGGYAARNIAAGLFPKVKAFEGHLPERRAGIEFYTMVEPDPGRIPGCPVWSGPRTGVSVAENDPDMVMIAVRIVRRVDR